MRKPANKSASPKKATTVRNYRIMFRDEAQLSLVKKAAREQGIPFNTFVTEVCEKTARILLKTKPHDVSKIMTAAVNAALTER